MGRGQGQNAGKQDTPHRNRCNVNVWGKCGKDLKFCVLSNGCNCGEVVKYEGWYELTTPYTQEIWRLLRKERLDRNIQDLDRKGPMIRHQKG